MEATYWSGLQPLFGAIPPVFLISGTGQGFLAASEGCVAYGVKENLRDRKGMSKDSITLPVIPTVLGTVLALGGCHWEFAP